MTGDTRTDDRIERYAAMDVGTANPTIIIYRTYPGRTYYSGVTVSSEKKVYDLSIWKEWLVNRPLESLYLLPEIIRRRVLWMTRKFPAWKRGRWKAKS